jgi:hypothetical protein
MNRRTAIRNVVLISAGAALLPSCLQQDSPSVPLKNLPLSGAQEKMLAELAETIIPKTNNFIGAKDLQAHEFVLTMVDDCMAPEDRQKFIMGMKQFEEGCEKKWNRSFVKCNPQQRKEWLQLMESKQDVPEDAVRFYAITKHYTLQSFTSSKMYMTDIRKYRMVPGNNYRGCVAVNKS